MTAFERSRHVAIVIALLAISTMIVLTTAVQAQTPLGQVVAVTGYAGLIRDGIPRAVTGGTEVVSGDRLVTGERAMVAVGVDGGAVLTAGHATDLTVTTYEKGRDGHRLTLSLARGILRAHLASGAQWQSLAISAPTAIATTQTGAFVVEADLFDAAVYAIDARVRVASAPDVPVRSVGLLGPGMGIDVRRGEPAARPMPWTEAAAAPLLARTDLR